jgi:isocitrate dehydrogenase (NAD+)
VWLLGANIGADYAVFEAIHGSAPKYAGQNRVNPTALILSGVMMLRHLGEIEAAERLQAAVEAVIGSGQNVTYDLRPKELIRWARRKWQQRSLKS